jgi:hypothetical protein
MLDTVRSSVSLSPMFSWGNPTQRPNGCGSTLNQRAFVVSAVVNRSSLRAHKERTDGGLSPQKTSPHPVLIGSGRGTPFPACKSRWNNSWGNLLLASAQRVFTAFDIVAIQFLKIEALRAEYQNPRMAVLIKTEVHR